MSLLLFAPAAEARSVPLNTLAASGGQVQRRGDGTMLLRPGTTLRADVGVRDGRGMTVDATRQDRCNVRLRLAARLGDQSQSSTVVGTSHMSFGMPVSPGTAPLSLTLTQSPASAKPAGKKKRAKAKRRRSAKRRGAVKPPRRARAARRVRPRKRRRAPAKRKAPAAAPCRPSVLLRSVGLADHLPLQAAMSTANFGKDPFYQPLFLEHFDGLTPENELKWASTEPQQGHFTFDAGDRIVDWARANGKSVRGHVLVWDFQNSSYVDDPKDFFLLQHHWTRPELIAVMQEHIQNVVTHFRGRVPEWDVVNEAFNDDGTWKDNLWHKVIGPEYVSLAFQFAHQADPQAKLFYNDLGYEVGGPHTDAVYNMVRGLREKGVPIDGVGFESHFNTGAGYITERMAPVLQAFANLGLTEEITELDVDTTPSATDKLGAQAEVYRQVVRACVQQMACRRVTTWGVSDRYSWIGSDRMALPFDADFHAKPAWQALQAELRPSA